MRLLTHRRACVQGVTASLPRAAVATVPIPFGEDSMDRMVAANNYKKRGVAALPVAPLLVLGEDSVDRAVAAKRARISSEKAYYEAQAREMRPPAAAAAVAARGAPGARGSAAFVVGSPGSGDASGGSGDAESTALAQATSFRVRSTIKPGPLARESAKAAQPAVAAAAPAAARAAGAGGNAGASPGAQNGGVGAPTVDIGARGGHGSAHAAGPPPWMKGDDHTLLRAVKSRGNCEETWCAPRHSRGAHA